MRDKLFSIIPKISVLVCALLIAVSIAACTSQTDEIANRVSKNVGFMDRDNPFRVFNGETQKTVTELIDTNIEMTAGDASKLDKSDVVSIDMLYKVTLDNGKIGGGLAGKLPWNKPRAVITTLLPKSINNKQSVLDIEFSLAPTRVFDVGDNRYAEFDLSDIKEVQTDIHIKAKMQLYKYDLDAALKMNNPGTLPKLSMAQYLQSEPYLEKKDPSIVATAKQIQGANDVDTLQKIYDFVKSTMTYDDSKARDDLAKADGAADALQRTTGVCVDYADLFIALCRAKGIPARYIGGIITEESVTTKGHAWAEVYLKNYGWVPFDPTWGDTGAASFYSMRPSYIYLTDVRNDEVIDGSNIYAYRYYGKRAITVNYTVLIDSGRAKYIGDMKSTIDVKRSELDQTKGRLNLMHKEIEDIKDRLDNDKAELDLLKDRINEIESGGAPGGSDYGSVVSRHNERASSYNQNIQTYNLKVADYEELRKSYESEREKLNALVDQYNALN